MEEADQLADKIYIMDQGKISTEGSPDELKQKFMKNNRIFIKSERDFSDLIHLLQEKNYSYKTLDHNSVILDSINGKLSVLIRDLEGIEMEEFTMKKPNLEDVFLELTGNSFSGSPVEPQMEVV